MDAEKVKDKAWMIKTLNELGCSITQKDLKGPRPSQEILQQVHQLFLQICLQCTPKCLEIDEVQLMLYFRQETVHESLQAYTFLKFVRIVYYFQKMCDLEPSFYDIVNPTMGQFKKNINRMIRFAQFQSFQLQPFIIIQEKNSKFSNELEGVNENVNQLADQIKKLHKQRRKLEPISQERKKNIDEIKAELSKLQTQLKNDDTEIEEDDKAMVDLQAKIKDERLKKLDVDNKIKFIELLTIKSPTRLKRAAEESDNEMRVMARLNDEKKDELKTLQKLYAVKDKFNDGFAHIEELMHNFINTSITKLNESVNDIQSTQSEMDKLKKIDLKAHELTLNSLTNDIETIKKENENSLKSIDDEEINMLQNNQAIEISTKNLIQQYKENLSIKEAFEEQIEKSDQEFERVMKNKFEEHSKIQKDIQILNDRLNGTNEYFKELYDRFTTIDSKLNEKMKHIHFKIQKYMNY